LCSLRRRGGCVSNNRGDVEREDKGATLPRDGCRDGHRPPSFLNALDRQINYPCSGQVRRRFNGAAALSIFVFELSKETRERHSGQPAGGKVENCKAQDLPMMRWRCLLHVAISSNLDLGSLWSPDKLQSKRRTSSRVRLYRGGSGPAAVGRSHPRRLV